MPWIEVAGAEAGFDPGAAVRGQCGWSLPGPPREAALELGWRAEARGTATGAVIETRALNAGFAETREDFAFTLPEGPYAFDGQLIRLRWYVRLRVGKQSAEVDFAVSPWTQTPRLEKVDGPPITGWSVRVG